MDTTHYNTPLLQAETRAQRRRRQRQERKIQELRSQGVVVGKGDPAEGMNSYIRCMEEVATRSKFIQEFYDVSIDRFPGPVVAETIGLQLRKTLELIAKASLVAHRSVWDEISLWFERDWHAREILNQIEQVNPSFYPHPVRETRVYETGNIKAEWEDVPDDAFLTKERFIEAYDSIGDMMHAHSPEENVDYRAFLAKTQEWDGQIHELLGMHEVFLLNADSFYLVQMNVGGRPKWSYWTKIEPSDKLH